MFALLIFVTPNSCIIERSPFNYGREPYLCPLANVDLLYDCLTLFDRIDKFYYDSLHAK